MTEASRINYVHIGSWTKNRLPRTQRTSTTISAPSFPISETTSDSLLPTSPIYSSLHSIFQVQGIKAPPPCLTFFPPLLMYRCPLCCCWLSSYHPDKKIQKVIIHVKRTLARNFRLEILPYVFHDMNAVLIISIQVAALVIMTFPVL